MHRIIELLNSVNPLVFSVYSLIMATIFTIAVYRFNRKEEVESYSKCYYKLKRRWLFQWWVFAISVGMVFSIQTALSFWAFLLLNLVTLFPTTERNDTHFTIHMIGAVGSILLVFLSIWIDFNMPAAFLSFSVIAVLLGYLFKRYSFKYIETIALYLVPIICIYYHVK